MLFRSGFHQRFGSCFSVCLRFARCCLVRLYGNLLGALATTARTAAFRLCLGGIIGGIAVGITVRTGSRVGVCRLVIICRLRILAIGRSIGD